MPLLLDWRNAGQPDAVVLSIVEAMRQGTLAMLPTESGYVAVVNAAHTDAANRLLAGAGSRAGRSLELWVAGLAELQRLTGPVSAEVERITTRLWPGPLVVAVPLNEGRLPAGPLSAQWAPDGCLRARSPSHPAAQAVLLAVDFPILAVETGQRGADPETVAAWAENWGDALVVVDAGPIEAKSNTIVLVEATRWRIEATGTIGETEVREAAAQWIVFVCTGNTCRSPMAEAMCKSLLAGHLGCEIAQLAARGFRIVSAGVAASFGDGPAPEAVDILREFGADLSGHRSQPLSLQMVAHADHLIAMTRSHLLAVLSRYPAIGGSMRLLCGAEGDLGDPIGGGAEIYTACARTILRHIDRFLLELVRQ
jgi:L-threonylcarbamoyladenylate synthase